MSAETQLQLLHQQLAMLAAARHRAPVRIRMHPLDWEDLRARYTPDAHADTWARGRLELLGCELIVDDAVTRGFPEAEYV